MPLPRLPKPPSARELRTTENQLARILKAGLAREGLQTRPSRECTIFVELDDRIEIWISAYEDDLRWWRIAERYAVTVPTVFTWLRTGIIPAKIAVGRVYRFDLDEVDTAVQRRSVQGGRAQSDPEGAE